MPYIKNGNKSSKPGNRLHPITALIPFEVWEDHGHTFWEFTFLLKGTADNFVNGKTYPMKRGDLILLGPNDRHHYRLTGTSIWEQNSYSHRDLYIDAENMEKICDALGQNLYRKLLERTEPKILHLSEENLLLLDKRLRRLSLADPEHITEEERTIQYATAAYILGLFSEQESSNEKNYPAWLISLMAEIKRPEIFCGDLIDIVKLSNFSHEHLCREFKKYTHITLLEYMTKLRMEYALSLVENTDYDILNISNIVGYNSLSHFIRKFQQYYGQSPGKLRKTRQS